MFSCRSSCRSLAVVACGESDSALESIGSAGTTSAGGSRQARAPAIGRQRGRVRSGRWRGFERSERGRCRYGRRGASGSGSARLARSGEPVVAARWQAAEVRAARAIFLDTASQLDGLRVAAPCAGTLETTNEVRDRRLRKVRDRRHSAPDERRPVHRDQPGLGQAALSGRASAVSARAAGCDAGTRAPPARF